MGLVGPYFLVCGLLAVGGLLKVGRPAGASRALAGVGLPSSPAAARLLGLGETALGVGGVVAGSRLTAALVGATYLALAGFVAVAMGRPGQPCGCFGADSSPATGAHLLFDGAAAAVALSTAVAQPGASIASVINSQPAGGLPFVLLTASAGYLAYLLLAALPAAARGGSR